MSNLESLNEKNTPKLVPTGNTGTSYLTRWRDLGYHL